MITLAVLWLAYIGYKLICMLINYFKHREIKILQVIDLLCNLCLGILLLLTGLSLNDILKIDTFILVIPVVLYLIGKIITERLKQG